MEAPVRARPDQWAARPRPLRRAAAALALAGLIAIGVVIAVEAAGRRSGLVPATQGGFPGWLQGPFGGIGDGITREQLAYLLIAMSACYLIVLAVRDALHDRTVIGAVVLLHVIFLLAPPLLSADIMGYIDYARLGAVHGLNPYSHLPSEVPTDPAYAYFPWRDLTSPYGPFYTVPSYLLAPLGVPAAMWTLKAMAFGCALGCVALTAWIARRLDRPAMPAVALVGLNPLWLVSGVGGGHNDFVMLILMLAAVALTVAGREAAGGACVAAAAAVKAAGLVLLPFVVAGAHERRRAAAGAAATLAAAVVVALAFFGPDGIRFVDLVRTQQELVALHSVPNEIGRRVLGVGGLTDGIRLAAALILAATAAGMVWRAWRGEDWITAAGWTVLAVLVTTAWLVPWYIVWLLPLAALGLSRPLRIASHGLLAFIVLARFEDWFV